MSFHYLFRDLAYVFVAAIAGGMLAWRTRQPLILGYVIAGILISPVTPGPSVHDMKTLEAFAELGVIFLMFSVGLEFSVKDLLQVKWIALIGGPIGIVLSIGLGAAATRLLGWPMPVALVVGSVICITSTMVLMRMLMDRGEIQTAHGRVTVALSLIEDLAAVFLIILVPTFKDFDATSLEKLGRALGEAALILVPAFFLAAKVIPPLMRSIARTHDQELFFVVVIAICFGAAALTQAFGLSLALGAFVGGLLISSSEYAHQSLAQMFPLRDMFVALFFVTIGLLMDPQSLFASTELLKLTLLMIAVIVIGKALLWGLVVRLFGYPIWTALMVAVGLTQIGEFSYVLVQVARGAGVIGDDVYNATLAASLVSIVINATLMKYAPDWAAKLRTAKRAADVEPTGPDAETLSGHVVICGFTDVGEMTARAFEQFGIRYAVIDLDPDHIRALRKRGVPSIFGDATHARILEHAHVDRARAVVIAVVQPSRAEAMIHHVRTLNAEAPVLVRAHQDRDYQYFLDAGATVVVLPQMEAAATLVRDALSLLKEPDQKTNTYVAALRRQQAPGKA